MSYDEPTEWLGHGARDRSGWPNRTFEPDPAGPRSHRAAEVTEAFERRAEWIGVQFPPPGVQQKIVDTGEFRAPYEDEMPTDPAIRGPLRGPGQGRRVIRPRFTLTREDDPLWRVSLWLGVLLKVLGIVALVGVIWVLAVAIRSGGVPIWVPR